MKVLAVRVGQPPVVEDLKPGLEPMQKFVGGYIEQVSLEYGNRAGGLGLICNEEGGMQGLEPNRWFEGIADFIRGDFFVSRYDAKGEAIDITDEDVARYSRIFQ